jgi:hypothetical protein
LPHAAHYRKKPAPGFPLQSFFVGFENIFSISPSRLAWRTIGSDLDHAAVAVAAERRLAPAHMRAQ